MAEGGGNTAGIIRLDLVINAKIEDTIKEMADKAAKTAEKQFEAVGEAVEKSVSEPVERAAEKVKKPLQKVKEEAQKTADGVKKSMESAAKAAKSTGPAKPPKPEEAKAPTKEATAAPDAPRAPPEPKAPKKYKELDSATRRVAEMEAAAQKAEGATKKAVEKAEAMANPWKVATDKAGLMEQKLDTIYSQMGSQEQKLKDLVDQYNQLGSTDQTGAAGQKINDQITSAQSKLISLQSSALQMEEAIAKATAAPAEKARQTWQAATDEVGQLRQQLQLTASQIEAQNQKLAQTQAEYRKIIDEQGKDSAAATKKLEQINAIKGKLLSLQKSAQKTSGELDKMMDSRQSGKLENAVQRVKSKVQSAGEAARKSISKNTKAAADEGGKNFNVLGGHATKMGKNIKSAFKRVFVMATLYAGFRALKDYMGQAAAQNKEFAASLNQVRGNLSTAFASIFSAVMPALNALMKGLATVTKYVATFIATLFGSTYKKSAETAKGIQNVGKAASGAGKAAKKAAGELAAFDQLNVLSKQEDSGGGGGGAADTGVDFGALDTEGAAAAENLANKIKSAFASAIAAVGGYFKDNLLPNVQQAIDRVAPEFERLKGIMAGVWTDLTTLGQPFMEWFEGDFTTFLQTRIDTIGIVVAGLLEVFNTVFGSIWNTVLFPFIQDFTTTLLPVITQAATQLQLTFQTVFTAIKDIFLTLWTGAVEPVMTQIMKIWTDVTGIISDLWEKYGESTFEKVREAVNNTKEMFLNAWETYLKPTWDTIMETIDWVWTKHLKPLVKQVGEFVAKFIDAALEIYNKFISPIVGYLQQILGPVFQKVWSLISSVVGTAVAAIADVISGLLKALGGLVDFITGVFTGDWKKAWNGVKDIFGGIIDGIKGIFKGAINLVIDIINDFTGGLNWIPEQLSKVPGFGWAKNFKIPKIPKFAEGGIVDRPTLGLMGEAGAEAVIPLKNNREGIREIARQLAEERGAGGNEEALYKAFLRALKEFFGAALPLPDVVVKFPDGTIERVSLAAWSKYRQTHGGALPVSI